MVLLLAIKDRATEVRFGPQPGEIKVRYLADADFVDRARPPATVGNALVNWIKVMAELDFPNRLPVREATIFLHVPGGFTKATIRIESQTESQLAIVRFHEQKPDLAASIDEVLNRY
jgi:type II secretory ATPase GspE/PulE/Tfp pilus assembly ATPase PilB-like protein